MRLIKIYSCQITTCSSRLSLILTAFLISAWKFGFPVVAFQIYFRRKIPNIFTLSVVLLLLGIRYWYKDVAKRCWRRMLCLLSMTLGYGACILYDDHKKKVDIYGRDLWQHNCSHVYSYVLTYINGVLFQKRYPVSLMLSFLIDMQNFGHNGRDQHVNFY